MSVLDLEGVSFSWNLLLFHSINILKVSINVRGGVVAPSAHNVQRLALLARSDGDGAGLSVQDVELTGEEHQGEQGGWKRKI